MFARDCIYILLLAVILRWTLSDETMANPSNSCLILHGESETIYCHLTPRLILLLTTTVLYYVVKIIYRALCCCCCCCVQVEVVNDT